MAPELLVDERIEDGGRLATELVRSGFDITAAFWIRTQEEGLWFFYVASPSVKRDGYGNVYRTVYATVSRLGLRAISPFQIKLADPSDAIAAEVIAVRDRLSARIPTRLGPGRLDGITIEEAYIYPPVDRALTRSEVIQAVTALMNRTGVLSPSSVTLRDGSTFLGIPTAIQKSPGRDVTVTLLEHSTGRDRTVSADEIAAIQ